MPRRTLPRHRALLTLASQPWTLYEAPPGDGGGGGGGNTPTLNEHGYPDGTPVADMEPTHQVAYWKHHARKHEQRANTAPDATELQRLKDRDAALKKLEDEQLTDAQRIQAEKDAEVARATAAETTAAQAVRKALVLEIALDKGLTVAQANRLQGSTKEELEADADELLKLFGGNAGDKGDKGGSGYRSGGNRGGDVGGAKTTATGAERYRQRHGKQS
ncbi:hypothetical protein ACIQMR_35130 [Streptomyces sp. NPDC091376]|uniref:hypothetical protein n=1 Tax=Streptomyces sp. NPDC091376 TaxID=3365994 RepID=UPI0038174EC6